MPTLQDNGYSYHKYGGHEVTFIIYRDDENPTGVSYYQYVSNGGRWYIMRSTYVGGDNTYEFYFASKTADIDTGWTGRAGLTYERYDEAIDAL